MKKIPSILMAVVAVIAASSQMCSAVNDPTQYWGVLACVYDY